MELVEAVGPRGAQAPGQDARPDRSGTAAGRDHAPDVVGWYRLPLAAGAGCASRRRDLSRPERGSDPMIKVPHLGARVSRPVPAAPGASPALTPSRPDA